MNNPAPFSWPTNKNAQVKGALTPAKNLLYGINTWILALGCSGSLLSPLSSPPRWWWTPIRRRTEERGREAGSLVEYGLHRNLGDPRDHYSSATIRPKLSFVHKKHRVGRFSMKVAEHIPAPQKTNPSDLNEPVIFPLKLCSGQTLRF